MQSLSIPWTDPIRPRSSRTPRSARSHPPPLGRPPWPEAQSPAPPPPRRKSRGPSLRPTRSCHCRGRRQGARVCAGRRGATARREVALQLGDLSTPFLSPNGGGDDGERGPGGESPHTHPHYSGRRGRASRAAPTELALRRALALPNCGFRWGGFKRRADGAPLLPLGASAAVLGTAGDSGGTGAFRGAASKAGRAEAAFPAKSAQFQADSVPALLPQLVGEDARVPRRPREGIPQARLSLPGGRAPRRAGPEPAGHGRLVESSEAGPRHLAARSESRPLDRRRPTSMPEPAGGQSAHGESRP